jgi:hypothetical protein
MKDLNELNYARDVAFERQMYGLNGDSGNGVFRFMSCVDAKPMAVIASCGDGWDHVSVSRNDRVPNYEEMEQIAKLFFRPNEYAVQYHVPESKHVNVHNFCLHWWSPIKQELPVPPGYMVGPK